MAGTLGLSTRPALYQVILPVALADVPLFAALDQASLDRLAIVSPLREVEADTVVAVRGVPARHLVVAETGGLSAVHETEAGQRRRLGEFAAPCAVDKAAVLDGGGHTATWVTTARSRLRFVPATEFLALVDVPSVRAHVFTKLAGQLRSQQEDLVLTSFADATTRVAAWLVRAATPRVRLPGAQQGLAETLGLTRVSVNRALRTLTSEGLVRVEPGTVVVLAPELLTLRGKSG
jgi:CRP/FNR family transcriptional regulator, cyclic AMP receptor protein